MSEKTKEEKSNLGSNGASNLPPDIKKAGILRKLKTMKKKYFVLRMESESGPARLEYYDSEKKFRSGIAPKRSIVIKNCFNINRKVDAKQKLAIALYTKDDCFSVVAESESLLEEWLKAMLELQLDDNCVNGESTLKPKFEHVWQVTVGEKSLACSRNMRGSYRLCLTNKSLTLIKMEQSDNPETLELPLMSIRRCGHSNNYFLIELGRSSITGAGELWLETEDVVIAQNMHEVTLNAMKTCREHEDMGPHRPRSSSNTETSRPIATRRPVAVVSAQPNAYPSVRDRCDSMPSRPRTISEGQEIGNRCLYASPSHPLESLRPHGSFSRYVMSYSPPGLPNPLSPSSTACSTDSAGSSLSIDEYDGVQTDFGHGRYTHSMPTDNAILTEPTIKEEQLDDYMNMSLNTSLSKEPTGYMHMAPIYSTSAPTGPSLSLNINPIETSMVNSSSSSSQACGYVEMMSPLSPSSEYMSMSPGFSNAEVKILNTDSARNNPLNHGLIKATEGYLYMAPASSSSPSGRNEGYLDMAPLSSSLPKTSSNLPENFDIFALKSGSCGVSDASLASSDATKSEEYQLDKVKSLLTQTDDASEDYIRPVRAYSMGSRPQPKKTHLSIHDEGCRIRAYSVGSQAASSRNKTALNHCDRDYGSIKRIDVRAGVKSSSAPLLHNRPPRMRTSTSRADVGEDLMEIDYNKSRILRDKDFTIEPVGRNRSGSYSSSSFSDKADRKNKLVYDRDKGNLNFSGHNKSSHSENLHDYLSMSPLSDSSRSSSLKSNSSMPIKTMEHYYPQGDYVSLSPSVLYSSSPSNPIKTLSNSLGSNHALKLETMSQLPESNAPLMNDRYNSHSSLKTDASQNNKGHKLVNSFNINTATNNVEFSNSIPETVLKSSNGVKNTVPVQSSSSDYVCMTYNSSAHSTTSDGENAEISKGSGHNSSYVNSSFPRSPSGPAGLNQLAENLVPKTPPPSPQSGVRYHAGASMEKPLMANPAYHPSKSVTHSAPNSRPTSVSEDHWLNYASLDLLPPTEEDNAMLIMPVHCMRLAANIETKEVPLAYAQIDFSNAKPTQDTLKESLSHL